MARKKQNKKYTKKIVDNKYNQNKIYSFLGSNMVIYYVLANVYNLVFFCYSSVFAFVLLQLLKYNNVVS